MDTEFEAKFLNIDIADIKQKLQDAGASLVRPEYMQKKVNFHLPKEKRSNDAWLRVRDQGDKITMALKMVGGSTISDQKEIEFVINDFEKAKSLLIHIGCESKALQESKREMWMLEDVQITIDTWPAMEPFIEVEGKTEQSVKMAAEKLHMDYSKAIFSGVGRLYKMKYGKALDDIEVEYGDITFDNVELKKLLSE